MRNKIQSWFRKFWGFIIGLGILIPLLVGLIDFYKGIQGLRATPTLSPTITPTSTLTPTNTPIPTISPTSTPGPFQFIDLPSQVKAGVDVKVTVLAWQGALCHLDYFTPDGNPSQAEGLGSVSPNSQARCTWEWHIKASTLPGIGKLVVSINDIKETYEIEILPGN